MVVAFAHNLLIIIDFRSISLIYDIYDNLYSKNSSDPISYAFDFEYFERNNFKIDKIKLEGDKKLLVMVDFF